VRIAYIFRIADASFSVTVSVVPSISRSSQCPILTHHTSTHNLLNPHLTPLPPKRIRDHDDDSQAGGFGDVGGQGEGWWGGGVEGSRRGGWSVCRVGWGIVWGFGAGGWKGGEEGEGRGRGYIKG